MLASINHLKNQQAHRRGPFSLSTSLPSPSVRRRCPLNSRMRYHNLPHAGSTALEREHASRCAIEPDLALSTRVPVVPPREGVHTASPEGQMSAPLWIWPWILPPRIQPWIPRREHHAAMDPADPTTRRAFTACSLLEEVRCHSMPPGSALY